MAARLTREACRAARALLGLTTHELAAKIGVSPTTINSVEAGEAFRPSTERKIVDGLELLGVEITNGNGTGARLRFAEVRAHRHDNGEWMVLAKLKEGDPVTMMAIGAARQAAADAEAQGDEVLAAALLAAADDASRYQQAG